MKRAMTYRGREEFPTVEKSRRPFCPAGAKGISMGWAGTLFSIHSKFRSASAFFFSSLSFF